jgi:hypothetical protein
LSHSGRIWRQSLKKVQIRAQLIFWKNFSKGLKIAELNAAISEQLETLQKRLPKKKIIAKSAGNLQLFHFYS